MKKKCILISTLILGLVILVSSCTVSNTDSSSPDTVIQRDSTVFSEQTTLQNEEDEIVYHKIYPITFPTIEKLVEKANIILIGKIIDSKITLVNMTSDGYIYREDDYIKEKGDMYVNVSSLTIQVTEVMKGSIGNSEEITIDTQRGGRTDGLIEIYEPALPIPETGKTYIFFIRKDDSFNDKEYFKFMFCGSFDGFVGIENDRIVPQDPQSVFYDESSDVIIQKIEDLVNAGE